MNKLITNVALVAFPLIIAGTTINFIHGINQLPIPSETPNPDLGLTIQSHTRSGKVVYVSAASVRLERQTMEIFGAVALTAIAMRITRSFKSNASEDGR